MKPSYRAHWHKTSYERFLHTLLPELLASRLPLAGYDVNPIDPYRCRITVSLAAHGRRTSADYLAPQPDDDGVFMRDGHGAQVVTPTVLSAALAAEEIACVGEQLFGFVRDRLGEPPPGTVWNEKNLHLWLPLESLIETFFQTAKQVESLNSFNPLARIEHLRQLYIDAPDTHFHPDQFGRVCPIMTPEGPNVHHIRFIAMGAEVRGGRLIPAEESPSGAFSVSASLIPFLEYTDRNRNMIGASIRRQWHIPPDPEPALIQTGFEPDMPDFWCGRNLLTAFILWDGYTYQEGIVLSESGASRLGYPGPLGLGDKLSDRHGVKGTVARILPDDRMPHLPDGSPVELIYSSLGLLTRFMMGPLKEAVMGRIARAEGVPVIVPPLNAPSEAEMRSRLIKNDLPQDGMETLTVDGKPLPNRSAVGWVYWGKTHHDAHDKIRAISHLTPEEIQAGPQASAAKTVQPRTFIEKGAAVPPGWHHGQRQGNMEYWTLRDLGAYAFIREQFNLRDDLTIYDAPAPVTRDNLADRLASGPVEPAGPPTPRFLDLQRRLGCAGIRLELKDESLRFRFDRPTGQRLKLIMPVPHPYLHDRMIEEVGLLPGQTATQAVAEVNARLSGLVAGNVPDSLLNKTREQLEDRLAAYFDGLIHPLLNLFPNNRMLFSGRGVTIPNPDLHYDRVGLPEEMAWVLFGPLAARETGGWEKIKSRDEKAVQALEAIMERSWVVLTRAPSVALTTMLAFRPVCVPGSALQVHPFFAPLMEGDFDGDQAAVFLPVTEAGQEEAARRLSVSAQATRDPALLTALASSRFQGGQEGDPTILSGLVDQQALWGLARLSLAEQGRREIAEIAGIDIDMAAGYLTRAALDRAVTRIGQRDGVPAALDALERLMRRGFEVAKDSGVSIGPFFGSSIDRSGRPATDDPVAWDRYAEELLEQVMACTDFDDPDLGAMLLSVKSGARGRPEHLRRWIGAAGHFVAAGNTLVPVKTSLSEGLSFETLRAEVFGSHRGITQFYEDGPARQKELRDAKLPKGFNVLARAARHTRPGLVFARAAANEEVDPLLDVDSRLLVGLMPR